MWLRSSTCGGAWAARALAALLVTSRSIAEELAGAVTTVGLSRCAE